MTVEDRRYRDLIAQLKDYAQHKSACVKGLCSVCGCAEDERAHSKDWGHTFDPRQDCDCGLAALLLAGEGRSEQTDDEETRQSSASTAPDMGISAIPAGKAPCFDCGHPFDKHPNGIDCAADDGFDNCGCQKFIADRDVATPLSVLYGVRIGLREVLGCRQVQKRGCDCKVGGQMALSAIEAMIKSATSPNAEAGALDEPLSVGAQTLSSSSPVPTGSPR